MDYRKYGAEISVETFREETKALAERQRYVGGQICLSHLKGLLGLWRIQKCPQCPKRHLTSLQEVTLAEVVAITEDWSIPDKEARDSCKLFRPST